MNAVKDNAENNYRLLVEQVKDYAIFMLDPKGNILTWNKGAKRIKGYTEEEILGRHFSVFYTKEAKESRFPEYELREAAKNGRFEDEGWRVRKDGSKFWANVIVTALYNNGKLVGFSKVTRDLTERRNTEEKLRQSEEQYRLLVEQVRDYAIFMLNPEGFITTWNKGAETINGYTAEEIIGRHFSIFYSREAVESGFPQYELKVASKEGRFEDEGWRIRKDGRRIWANVIITALHNKQGELVGFSKVTRDITDRKKVIENLQKSNAELRSFAYVISHDLKTPLRGIASLATWIQNDYADKLDDIGKEHLELMVSRVKRLNELINDILSYSQVGRTAASIENITNAGDIINEISNSFDIGNVDILYNCRLKSFRYDRVGLFQVFQNLISNGIKHNNKEKKKIEIKCADKTDHILFSVTDNGPGIEEKYFEKIFQLFQTLQSKDETDSTGIGLAIVKKLVENYGGRIWVESTPGQGSTFYFTIPKNL